jgi:adenylate cyclase
MTVAGAKWTESETAQAHACLDRVLASAVFAKSERQQRFIRYVVSETLAGHEERLKGYTIGVQVFDRDSRFDPTIDAIVRVEATRLRAKLREYYEGEGAADPVRFDLPKGAYSVRLEWRGPVPARHSPGAMPAPAAGSAGGGAGSGAHPSEERPSLAVLPFTNMSADPDQEYFADGITDNLITELSRVRGLFVISRHSSFVYKHLSKRAEDIGAELGVGYLMEGSVQRAGERVRITAQLIDAASGKHLWAERYDRELSDIFALQDDVTHRIAAVLQVKLAPSERERIGLGATTQLEAHDGLLRGLERFWLYTQASAEEAVAYFSRAVELDPGYALAHAWLARALLNRWIFLWEPTAGTLQRAYEHARLALDLDDRLPFAHAVMCWVQLWRRDGEAAIASGRDALALDPNNADACLFLSMALSAVGRGEEALHYIEAGMRLNPHPSAFFQFALGQCHLVLEDYQTAIAAWKRGAELRDPFIPNHYSLCIIYTLLGDEDEARVERDKVLALSGGRRPVLNSVWLDKELAERWHALSQVAGLE